MIVLIYFYGLNLVWRHLLSFKRIKVLKNDVPQPILFKKRFIFAIDIKGKETIEMDNLMHGTKRSFRGALQPRVTDVENIHLTQSFCDGLEGNLSSFN